MSLIQHSTACTLGIALLACAAWLPLAGTASAQQDEAMFRRTRDPKVISMQIKAALPTLERGYAMLISTTDPEPTEAAVNLLHDTYRYLRAAQESSEVLESISKFPDPVTALRNRKILDLRDRLLRCWSNRTHLTDPGPIRSGCIEGLQVGLRNLRVMVATLP
jgi:hypothetical protein